MLLHVSERTALGLQMMAGEAQQSSQDILNLLDGAMTIPDFRNAMLLFLEVAARGSRGIEPFRSSAKATIAFWLSWLKDNLKVGPDEKTPRGLLTEIEGRIFLQLIEEG